MWVAEEEPQCSVRGRYYTRQEIELRSPSRRDGISRKKETELRGLYCSYLKELGMRIELPQVTIACAMMLCHHFYMRQSHAKNDWKTIATVSIFLACKIQDTRRPLNDVLRQASDILQKLDASALPSLRRKEVFKELVLGAEIILLSTVGFDFEMQLPYISLVEALRRLNLLPVLAERAWNYVNDCLCTSLCLQYEAHYIAAGSLFLAAEIQKVKLPKEDGKVWWAEFDVSAKQLDDVIQEMVQSLQKASRKQALSPKKGKGNQSETLIRRPSDPSSSQSCVSSEAAIDGHCRHSTLAEEDRGLGESIMSFNQNAIEVRTVPPRRKLYHVTHVIVVVQVPMLRMVVLRSKVNNMIRTIMRLTLTGLEIN
ncbi:PREDICTED: cyclin-T1-3-like [Fragaria vesca subsp. vesca]|uniref:cyclin-T1-3-like n=1 Tax=Fragaria vesca subsp. vesca TaxID=101020 RepID=UPI0002C348FC|nr:PREDICTED: cyclin-T1-3-like [Fragaria vesca subsp. vesca]XP_011467956.1 PREDICTED: cyclin-T1-3-like [Fragaria vesca subsp. vesca]